MEKAEQVIKKSGPSPSPSCVYFLGLIGASVFYISQASGFWAGVVGFLKALVWPAFLVYEAFQYLVA